jgi:hypothetical protein
MDKVTVAATKRRKKPAVPPCPYEVIVALYEKHLPMLPGVGLVTAERKKAMREMWVWVLKSTRRDNTRRAETAEQAVTWFTTYFETAALNDFITGKTPRSRGHEGWKADLTFLLSKRGMLQVIERTQTELTAKSHRSTTKWRACACRPTASRPRPACWAAFCNGMRPGNDAETY